jgi:YaiO family outer membrane protein
MTRYLLFFIMMLFALAPAGVYALPADQAAEYLNRGKQMLYSGQTEQGVKLLEQAASADPRNPFVMLYMAKGYSWMGKFDKAIELYKKASELSTGAEEVHWQALFGVAQVTSWKKDYDGAIQHYSLILIEYKDAPPAFVMDIFIAIGDVMSWRLEYDAAIEQFNKALAIDAGNLEAINRIGKIYFWDHEYAKAREYSKKVLERDPENMEAKTRIEEIELIKPYQISLGDTLTIFNSNNVAGDKIMRNQTLFTFVWSPTEASSVILSSGYARQNAADTAKGPQAGTFSDVSASLGLVRKFFAGTYLSTAFSYTFDAEIGPDYTAEAGISQKVSRNFDVLVQYKLTHDKNYEYIHAGKPFSHTIAPGVIFYFTENFYTHLQAYLDTDGDYMLYSFLFHQSLAFNATRDRLDFYVSYGRGKNYLVYANATVPVDVTTFGIAGSYTHFFNQSFGLRFNAGYHNRVDFYEDYLLGMEGIYQF